MGVGSGAYPINKSRNKKSLVILNLGAALKLICGYNKTIRKYGGGFKKSTVFHFLSPPCSSLFFLILLSVREEICTIIASIRNCFRQDTHHE